MDFSPRAGALFAAVREAVAGTAYQVEPTAIGFDVRIDFRDQSLPAPPMLGRICLIHHVAVDATRGTFSVTDDLRKYDWSSGSGTNRGPRITRGRINQRTWDSDGNSFNTATGRRLVFDAATRLGWSERQPTVVKVSMVAAIIGAAFAVLVLAALVVVFFVA